MAIARLIGAAFIGLGLALPALAQTDPMMMTCTEFMAMEPPAQLGVVEAILAAAAAGGAAVPALNDFAALRDKAMAMCTQNPDSMMASEAVMEAAK